MKRETITVLLRPPVNKAALVIASGGNLSRWANRVFSEALAAPRSVPAPRWARWLKQSGRELAWTEIEALCDAE